MAFIQEKFQAIYTLDVPDLTYNNLMDQGYIVLPTSISNIQNQADAISNHAFTTSLTEAESNALYNTSNVAYVDIPTSISNVSNIVYSNVTLYNSLSNEAYDILPTQLSNTSNDLSTRFIAISNQTYQVTVVGITESESNTIYFTSNQAFDIMSNQVSDLTVTTNDLSNTVVLLSNQGFSNSDEITVLSNEAFDILPGELILTSNSIASSLETISNQTYQVTTVGITASESNAIYFTSNQAFITIPQQISDICNVSNQAYVSNVESLNQYSNDVYTNLVPISNQAYVTLPGSIGTYETETQAGVYSSNLLKSAGVGTENLAFGMDVLTTNNFQVRNGFIFGNSNNELHLGTFLNNTMNALVRMGPTEPSTDPDVSLSTWLGYYPSISDNTNSETYKLMTTSNGIRIIGDLTVSGNGYVNGSSLITSDARLKHDISNIEDSLSIIRQLEPVTYNKRCLHRDVFDSGFIAQDVYKKAPDLRHLVTLPANETVSHIRDSALLTLSNDDPSWGSPNSYLNYNGFIAYLVKAVQELDSKLKQKGF